MSQLRSATSPEGVGVSFDNSWPRLLDLGSNALTNPVLCRAPLLARSGSKGIGGFLPAIKQIANVAALPGIVGKSVGLPDVHSGYGFAIGNMAAFDMEDPEAIVSPGGVGFVS